VRFRAALLLIAFAALTSGFSGMQRAGGRNPDVQVVRAWSAALNAGDDVKAASYFALNARVIQGALVAILRTHRSAVVFNASLPCSGRIVATTQRGHLVTATFVLGQRPGHRCDGPGQQTVAAFGIRSSRIVLWHQLPVARIVGSSTA
jgi:hypothetical protein